MAYSARRSRSPSGPPDALAMHSHPPTSSQLPRVYYYSERSSKITRPEGHYPQRMPDNSINRESYDRGEPPMLLSTKQFPPAQPFRHVEPGTLDRERKAKQKRMAEMLRDFEARNPELSDNFNSEDVPAYLLAPLINPLTVRSADQKQRSKEEQGDFIRRVQEFSGEVFHFDDENLEHGSRFYRLVHYPLSDNEPEEPKVAEPSSLDSEPVIPSLRNSTTSFSSDDSPRNDADLSPWIEPKRVSHHLDKLPGPVKPLLERHSPNAWPQLHVNLPYASWNAPSAPKRVRKPTAKSVNSANQVPKRTSKSTSSRRRKSPEKEGATTADQTSRTPSRTTSQSKRRRNLPTTELGALESKRKASHTGLDEPQTRRKGPGLPLYQRRTPIASKKGTARRGLVASSGFSLPPDMRTPSPKSKVEDWNFFAAPSQPEVSNTARPRSSPFLKLMNPDTKRRDVGKAQAVKAVQDATMSNFKTSDDAETVYDCACSYTTNDGREAVQCDRCDSWQHVVCFYQEGADLQEVQHLCTNCKPRYVGDIASLDEKQKEVRGESVSTAPVEIPRPRKDSATASRTKRSAKGKGKEKIQVPGGNGTRRSRKEVDYRGRAVDAQE